MVEVKCNRSFNYIRQDEPDIQDECNHEITKDRKRERKLLAHLNFSEKRSAANLTGELWYFGLTFIRRCSVEDLSA